MQSQWTLRRDTRSNHTDENICPYLSFHSKKTGYPWNVIFHVASVFKWLLQFCVRPNRRLVEKNTLRVTRWSFSTSFSSRQSRYVERTLDQDRVELLYPLFKLSKTQWIAAKLLFFLKTDRWFESCLLSGTSNGPLSRRLFNIALGFLMPIKDICTYKSKKNILKSAYSIMLYIFRISMKITIN